MAATALNRPQAVQMSVAMVHAFVKLSRMALSVDGLQSLKDLFADDALMFSHGPQNAIQIAHAQAVMSGHGQAMMGRLFRFQDNVTADLVDLLVAPAPAQYFDQFMDAKVSWDFHAIARTSSRIRWSLIAGGWALSKK